MSDQNLGVDPIEVSILRLFLDTLPVRLTISLHRLRTELPRTFLARIFFEAVVVCAIVDLDLLPMDTWIHFLHLCQPLLFLLVKVDKEL